MEIDTLKFVLLIISSLCSLGWFFTKIKNNYIKCRLHRHNRDLSINFEMMENEISKFELSSGIHIQKHHQRSISYLFTKEEIQNLKNQLGSNKIELP